MAWRLNEELSSGSPCSGMHSLPTNEPPRIRNGTVADRQGGRSLPVRPATVSSAIMARMLDVPVIQRPRAGDALELARVRLDARRAEQGHHDLAVGGGEFLL